MLIKYLTSILLISIFFLSVNKSFSQNENNRLNEQEITFIKENYNWAEEEVLLINYKQPVQFCHYDNYANIVNSHKWWDQFYAKMELTNVKNIFVYATERRARKIIDSVKHFSDKDSFLLNRFFREEKTCY